MPKRLIMCLVLSMVGFLLENITKRFKIFFVFPISILVSLHLYTVLHKLMEIFRFIFSVTGWWEFSFSFLTRLYFSNARKSRIINLWGYMSEHQVGCTAGTMGGILTGIWRNQDLIVLNSMPLFIDFPSHLRLKGGPEREGIWGGQLK